MNLIYGPDDLLIREELEWFWNFSESEMGYRSNFAAMQSIMRGCGRIEEPGENILATVSRRRRIERRLAKLLPAHERALRIMYGPTRIPQVITEVMGEELAGISLCTSPNMTIEEFITLCFRMKRGTGAESDHALLNRIRNDARELKGQVIRAYRATKEKRCPTMTE